MVEIIARGVTKRFPGVVALDGVDFTLEGGQVHAVVGENGAGKSTLMKILGGIQPADEGDIKIDGSVAVIHQELNLMSDLTVAQNIYFGREPKRGLFIDDDKMIADSAALLDRLGISLNPRVLVGDLTVAAQQMVEIAKALSEDAKILIMDEPTASLTDKEVATLFGVIRDFVTPETAVVYISHRMEEIMEITNRITILRDGKLVGAWDTKDLTRDDIIAQMVGRKIDHDVRPEEFAETGAVPGLEVTGLKADFVTDVSFAVGKGEIFGLAGLVGAGRTETARAIAGADPMDAGEIRVDGKIVDASTPEKAVEAGIGYLSEDRKQFGLLLNQDIVDNVALPSLKLWSSVTGVVDDQNAESVAEGYTDKLRIKTPSVRQTTRNLSGGNQQKVVLAKWMARDCDILFFDEPTRGIDVGAKDEIYALLEELAGQGKTIVVISSEIPELLRVCNRIGVMCDGRLTGILSNAEATQEKIMELATQFASIGKRNHD